MTIKRNFITLVLCFILYQAEAGDKEIWPIPTECPKTDPLDYTVHLQHESDCTKFYKCDHGGKVLFDCPAELHFNPVLQVCDWPWRANCTLNDKTTTTTPKPTPTPEPTPPADRDPECPWPDPMDHTVHLPHETDCTKFYKCDNGKKVEFDCRDGLHFNKELQVCDWPQNAGCQDNKPSPTPEPETPKPTPSETPEPETPKPTPPEDRDPECPWPDPLDHTVHLPHETDCTKFYKCDHGKKVEFDCPDGLHFNKELQVCDWPQDAGCESNKPSSTPKPTTEPTPSETPEPETPKPTPPEDRDPECPWPDPLDHTVHLPHETDCTKFYKCDHGKKVEFDCPAGLHFNKELQVCDWPGNAGCEDVKPDPTSKPTPEPTPSETPEPDTPEPTPPEDKDPECPWPDPLDHTVHLPHETDCTKFYKCDHGKKVEFDCPDGLHFNKELQVCDWPQDAGCESNKPSSTPKPTPEPTPSETPEPETPKPTPPEDRDPECPWPDPLDHTVHLPHETDCTKFYKCDHGKKVEFDCPAGLHFNKELQVCDWPGNAGCEDVKPDPTPKPTPEPTPSETPEPDTPEPTPPEDKDPECPWPDPLDHTVHLPHETDCTKFYKCDHGKKVEFDCPAGLHFNKELQVCDWPGNAGCEDVKPDPTPKPTSEPTPSETPEPDTPEPTPPEDRDPECPWPDPLDHTVHLPHETDCTKFYKCDHGKKVEFDCPDGLHFNKELQVCDWPGNAGCEEVNTDPTEDPTSSTDTPKPTPPEDRDPECPWPDPLNYTVHLPHETDCTKFYKCDHGKKVEFDCPDGLHFNKELQVCDWPGNAGCEEVNTDPTDDPTSSTETPKPTPPEDRDPECPWPDPLNYTVHLPHETDCTKFYKCDHGKKVEFDCPDGLHFNKELQVCDWPGNAGCEEVNTDPTEDPTSSTDTPKPTPPEDRDPECPWPDPLNYTVHLPHETDCTKFYKCDHGKKVEFDCPDGLHFNRELQVCDWPGNAGCEEVNTDPTEDPTSSTDTPKPTPPEDRDPECPWPDPLNYTVHLPHETDCTKFYKCDHGKKVEFDCPDGLHFNKELQVCDWPGNAGCEEVNTDPTEDPTSSTDTPKPTPPEDRDPECPWPDPLNYTVHLPHEIDCTKFYKCDHGQKVEFECPDGLHFNPELEVCDWPESAGCEDPIPEPCPSDDTDEPEPQPEPTPPSDLDPECPWPDPLNYTVHLPHEEDCTKFYKCDNGKKVEFDCPDGLHFNPDLEVCDWPENAGCENQSIQCPDTQCQDTTLYLPFLGNPRKYIRCVAGVEVINTCPGGLVFDKNLATCNLEHLVEPN
ncbi:peritrophic matrix protein 14 precursor [Tribolium castaneum]|uniref:Peritrophic matrix protein 14 n=1 Tax=Tribolium castaneum TaxID=7070 RepID=D1MAJ8_TRICA|nr:peritrophic matrix protein 14 precursor [Tribolium castaneum]ACY95489.1 peritrophic matrix protein 14 [Tribolium castaneum]KYB26070.1 hypothetical protein TcasGA2_TC033952 [Tribolium castaneum]|eukprot:NP_001161929.1 peritrophic matrix protein 14 precursor [Tribolium castaneum]